MNRIAKPLSGQLLPANRRQGVSVVICAKNEAKNLRQNLPEILQQRYLDTNGNPLYEVIEVDDGSEDDTQKVLGELKQQFQHLRILSVAPADATGKKNALRVAMQAAHHNWLLLTDADCSPASTEWLEHMVSPLAGGKDIVAGYSGYHKSEGILNGFVRWETMHTYVQYSSYALAGLPYMAVGRNMACTKTVLQKAMLHPVWNALPSGDDDLLVQVAGTADNVAIVCEDAAFTYSPAKTTWQEWAHQKQRHLSTGKYYKAGTKLMLGTYALTHAGMWLMAAVLLFSPFWWYVPVLMGARGVLYMILWVSTTRKLKEEIDVYLLPIFDLGWMMYNFAFLPYITWKNKKNWK